MHLGCDACITITLCMLGNFNAVLSSADFFFLNQLFSNILIGIHQSV